MGFGSWTHWYVPSSCLQLYVGGGGGGGGFTHPNAHFDEFAPLGFGVASATQVKSWLQVKVGGGHGFDWGYSRYFESAGVPLLALNRSMVEHFGRRGSWGAISSGEVAQNFDWKGVPAGLREGFAKMNEGAPSSAG